MGTTAGLLLIQILMEGMAPKESNTDFFAPTLEAHGNTGAPALNVGDTPTRNLRGSNISLLRNKETHADLSSKLDSRGTGSAPALNIGDTGGAPKQEGHTHFPAPKFEAHGHTGGAPTNS